MAYRIQCKRDIYSNWSVVGSTLNQVEACEVVKKMKKQHPTRLLCVVDLCTSKPILSMQ